QSFALAAEPIEIRLASNLPDNSRMARDFKEWSAKVEERTGRRISFRFYFDGSQGDERDVIRKTKLGQLDGGIITSGGLAMIHSDFRALRAPLFFASDAEHDYVVEKCTADFKRISSTAGFELVLWNDMGWVYWYSRQPIANANGLRQVKMWQWTEDTAISALHRQLGVSGVPLGQVELLSALQTGKVDAYYGTPLQSVEMDWYTQTRYSTSVPVAYEPGALMISNRVWNRISPADRNVILSLGSTLQAELRRDIRKWNDDATSAMARRGVSVTQAESAFRSDLSEKAEVVYRTLSENAGSQTMYDLVKRHRSDYRRRHLSPGRDKEPFVPQSR
ncbi:MAG TPA: TRAP transporter substrate-binding protein DctP, partial [Leptospiraceae bacterium]|nr:TRAP transporter substrate-binding protein DctP [Leptospiraceae bacterium]